jgi:amphi-Trp domain-containing protein
MADETLFQFEQTMSRSDVAAYLREVADKLDAGGALEFAAGGHATSVAVPERLQFEVDVERDRHEQGASELEIEFELEWYEDEDGTASGSLEIG